MLPKINEAQQFEIEIPSIKQVVHFRPYLVKEEKILMLAMESQDMKQILGAVTDTIAACVTEDLDVAKLTPYDVEYMFIRMRGKSVGEVAPTLIKCKKCEHRNDVNIDLDATELVHPEKEVSNMIDLGDDIKLELHHPSYKTISKEISPEETQDVESVFNLISKCLLCVHTPDNRLVIAEEPEAEVKRFVESLTSGQLNQIKEFMENVPKVVIKVNFECSECKEPNELVVEGIQNFF